jgi:hypothetical protein
MVASVSSSNSSSISNWADSIYSKLDTKNQGYIEKTDLQDALSKVSGNGGDSGQSVNVDDTFSALDGDSDGKVTKSELTEAMTKLSDQLNAQFDASRIGRGGPPAAGQDSGAASGSTDASATIGANGMAGMGGAGGPHGPHGGGRAGDDGDGDSTDATSGTSSTSSTSTDYVAAADTDKDGTVSDAEQAAYDKKVASGQADGSSSSSSSDSTSGTQKAVHQKDPMRELAHALHLLKAYAENSGGSDATTASTSDTSSSSSVSVED